MGAFPAFFRQLAEGLGRLAINDHLDVMKGRIGFAPGIAAALIIRAMFRGIPAPFAQIEASCKSDAIIDDHHFLMLGCTHRVLPVEAKVDAFVVAPLEPVAREKLPL